MSRANGAAQYRRVPPPVVDKNDNPQQLPPPVNPATVPTTKAAIEPDERPDKCQMFFIVVCVVFIILTLVAVILGDIFVATQDNLFRVCLNASSDQVIGTTSATGVWAFGVVNMDLSNNSIYWTLYPNANLSGITAFLIRGPMQPLSFSGAPVAMALCGYPNSEVPCITTVPGVVWGVNQVAWSGSGQQNDIRTFMFNYRATPYLYYYEILTNANPTTPGSARASGNGNCGFP
jgi:hypothetical protein